MKIKHFFYLLLVTLSVSSCNSNGQGVKNLNTTEFDKAIHQSGIQLVDVRTPEEYAEKHIAGSVNINLNSNDFEQQMNTLDKSKPTYVYCLSGARSSQASNWAAKNGFKEVYNLKGGITAWMGDQKPVEATGGGEVAGGMSFDEYLQQIKSDKLVLVDFNAVWCAPCKILKPIVKKVIKEHAASVQLLDIDVDKNSTVATTMKVQGIPMLLLYKDGKEVWRNMGLTDEATLTEQINKFNN